MRFYLLKSGDHFFYQGEEWVVVPATIDGERQFNATTVDGKKTKFFCAQNVKPK